MRRLVSPFLLAVLFFASAPTADAQLGRLVNRAREAISETANRAAEAVERVADRPAPRAEGAPATAADLGQLLDTQFFPNQGVFNFQSNMILFPPPGLTERDRVDGGFYVRDGSGAVISRHTIRGASSDVYDRVSPEAMAWLVTQSGVNGDRQGQLEPGVTYTLDLELYGEVIGSVPFTVQRTSNGDPFNPVTEITLIGPWQTHGYFAHKTDDPGLNMSFHTWIGSDETTEYTEVSIRRDGREVAWGPSDRPSRKDQVTRTHTVYPLFTADSRHADRRFRARGRNVQTWTIEDVTPGQYEVVLSTEAGPLRTMTITGAEGAFVPHPRSAVDYEPRYHFLTPRRPADTLYWIAPMD